jgi:hypothetical protein
MSERSDETEPDRSAEQPAGGTPPADQPPASPRPPADDSPTQVGLPVTQPESRQVPPQPGYWPPPAHGQGYQAPPPGYGQSGGYGPPPGYGAPPGYGYPPPPRRRGGASPLLVGLLALLLVLAIGVAAMYALRLGPFAATPGASPTPTAEPTPQPTAEPTPSPTPEPTPSPTPEPTPEITPSPTPEPTPEITPSPTPELTPTPDAGYGQLVGWITQPIRGGCEPYELDEPLEDAEAGALCQQPGSLRRGYALFESLAELQDAYAAVRGDMEGGDGTCPGDLPAESSWYYLDTPEIMRGQLLCYEDDIGRPWLVMSAEHALLLSWIFRLDDGFETMADLFSAFQEDVGVLPPGSWTP